MWTRRDAVLLVGLALVLQTASASIAVIAPGKIRLGTEQKIFLLGENLEDDEETYVITMCPRNNPSHTFYRRVASLQNDVLTSVSINVSWENIVPESSGVITLRVQSSSPGGTDKSEDIEIDKSPGHILIQLDKPVYTSRQKVKYRIMAVDERLRFPSWQVQISLMNPRGLMTDRVTKPASEAFTGDHFQLSRSPMKGEWMLKATFLNYSTESVATFEVKDYILPRFGLTSKCNRSFVLRSDSSPIHLQVKAEYVYGKPVQGRVSVTLMAKIAEMNHNILEHQQYQLDSEGSASIVYSVAEIRDDPLIGQNQNPVDLYVDINVTEHNTGNVLRKELKVTTFAVHPFELRVINRRNYFQPGLSYRFELEAVRPDGSPATNVQIQTYVPVERTRTETDTSDSKGRVVRQFPVPANRNTLTIKYRARELSNRWTSHTIRRVDGVPGHSIKVDSPQDNPITEALEISIRYTTPPGSYFILVTSRGHVVYSQSDVSGTSGVDVRTIPSRYLADMVPQARIVVFYMVGDQVVADSTVVQMRKVCPQELSLEVQGGDESHQPKDRDQIRVHGGPHMRVGLLAVDKGVYALKYEKSLTRRKMFDDLLSHDMGLGFGDGETSVEIFKSAGFTLLTEADMAGAGEVHSARSISADPSRTGGDNPLLRSYFPESWLFVERTLDAAGETTLDVTYPDTITTWIMYAVGVSPDSGICVSTVKKTRVFQDFFVDLDIPFRAVKLEEVTAMITVSNYMVFDNRVRLNVTANGVCVLGCEGNTKIDNFTVPAGQKVTRTVEVLPTRPGEYVITATAITESGRERDDVQKRLLVVSEGEPQTKSINFNLDPRGEDRNNRILRQDVQRNVQTTTVKLTFPKNTVPHSEQIQITASGDLLGFVLSTKLPSDSDGAGSLLKEMVPSCYGLHYLHSLDVLTPEVAKKGKQHIAHGLAELLKYRVEQGGFCEEEVDGEFDDNEPTIWFTTLALKTLCTADMVEDIQEHILSSGFHWLLGQITCTGSRNYPKCEVREKEENQRGLTNEKEQLMTEVLLAALHCSHHVSSDMISTLNKAKLSLIRHNNQTWKWRGHRGVLTMAKAARALVVVQRNRWKDIAKRLRAVAHSVNGYIFWTEQVDNSIDPNEAVFEPTAESIEATSYALMLFLHVQQAFRCRSARSNSKCRKYYVDVDPVADWLLQWRTADGLFIAAADTAAATEALAMYRNSKRLGAINLNVGVSTSPNVTYTHSLEFEQSDAFIAQALEDVPLGQELQVETEGTGLGQMHVKTTFNTPVDVNANCRFNFTVDRYRQRSNPGETDLGSMCGGDIFTPRESFTCNRDASTQDGAVIAIHCLKVCIKSNGEYNHGKLDIRLGMLSGYEPNLCDLEAQHKMVARKVLKATYHEEEEFVNLHLRGVSNQEMECYGFRIIKKKSVNLIKPATVSLKSYNVNEWACPRQYAGDEEVMSRPVYCSVVVENQYRGCTCVNDSCVACRPEGTPNLRYYRPRVESALYVFKLRAERLEQQANTGSNHLIFHVLEELKNCLGQCFTGSEVVFVTKRECGCPSFEPGTEYWAIGTEYNTYADSSGVPEHRFFLNADTFLLSAIRCHSDISNRNSFLRQSDNIREATGSYGNACPTGNQRESC